MTATLDDQHEIEQVAARLVKVFPEVPEPTIRDIVAAAWSQFNDSKVRDFVPVLAERRAKAKLRVAAVA
jgi:hypothetical protein